MANEEDEADPVSKFSVTDILSEKSKIIMFHWLCTSSSMNSHTMCWLFTTSSVRAICITLKPHSPQLVGHFATCLPVCLIGHPAVTWRPLLTPSFRHSSAYLPNWTSRCYLLITHYVCQYNHKRQAVIVLSSAELVHLSAGNIACNSSTYTVA